MKQYKIVLNGETPLIMHQDNLTWGEKIKAWQKDPTNREFSVAGDDRSPAWTWIGSLYHDGRVVGLPSDNLMTLLREGAAKVPAKGKETYKKQSQSGIIIDQQQWVIQIGERTVNIEDIKPYIGNNDFAAHIELAEKLGFDLLVKRAKIGKAKHVRVRPMFRVWRAVGSLTVLDEEISGLKEWVVRQIFVTAGAMVGVGDWRPSSPSSSGSFGRFSVVVTPM